MANSVMRITLKAYDHQLVDASARKIIDTVRRSSPSFARSTNIRTAVSSSSRGPIRD